MTSAMREVNPMFPRAGLRAPGAPVAITRSFAAR